MIEQEIWEVQTPVDPHKEGGKTLWLKMGIAFQNKDGSFNLYLNAYPVNGKLHMRKKKETKLHNDEKLTSSIGDENT